jgi:hypothetical protein
MKRVLFLFFALLLLSNRLFAQMNSLSKGKLSTKKNSYSLGDTLIDKVFELKEIKDLIVTEEKRPDSLKSKIAVMIIRNPSTKNPYYYFRAGYNGTYEFFTLYQFRLSTKFINKKKLDDFIYILSHDFENYIPLLIWRKKRSKEL